MFVGSTFNKLNFTLPNLILLLALFTLILFVSIYPNKAARFNRYTFQKVCDFAIGLSVFTCVCFLYNDDQHVSSFNNYTALHGSLVIPDNNINKNKMKASPPSISKKELKLQSKNLKKLLLNNPNEETGDIVLKILLAILVTAGAITLLLLVAALSCSLSCSGAEVPAIFVGIAGTVGVFALLFWALKKIFKKKKIVKKYSDALASNR